MPGIVGYISPDADPNSFDPKLDRMVECLLHQSYYKVTSAQSVMGRFACVHLGHFDHPVIASTPGGKTGVVLDGWLFQDEEGFRQGRDDDSAEDAARHCLNSYLAGGVDFVRRLNGQFNLLIWDERSEEVFLCNDRYGLRPWQYARFGDALYFAPEGKAILSGSKAPRKLNMRMVANQLSWGRIWIGDETLFENIFVLPPAAILRWHEGRITQQQYWDYVYTYDSEIDDEFIEHTVSAFRRAVARQTKAPLRYGVSLSGGLDSRAVLAALAHERDERGESLRTYSWGVSDDHDEVVLARQTAERLSVAWEYLPLEPEDFVINGLQGAFLSEGLDLAVQSYGLQVFPKIREHSDALLTGLALDLTLGGSYLSRELLKDEITTGTALTSVCDQSSLFSPEENAQLMLVDESREVVHQLHDEAIREWQSGQNQHPADKCDRFFLRTRVRRYTFMRQIWQRLFVEDFAPTFDNEFMNCLLRIPPEWRMGHRFYQKFLQSLCPAVMNIPYQRTLLPPSAPLEYWRAGTHLEEEKEKLYRQIWRETGGQVFIPYTRYSTNYDEWLRCDKDWIAMTNMLLTGPDSVSCETLLNREAVRRIVEEHRSAKRSNHKQIIQLMTLEFFLRRFFN